MGRGRIFSSYDKNQIQIFKNSQNILFKSSKEPTATSVPSTLDYRVQLKSNVDFKFLAFDLRWA